MDQFSELYSWVVELNHLSWTNRESNPGPLPVAGIAGRNMLREYYTTKPFARLDVRDFQISHHVPGV
ncbi:hypothetical protein CEP54_000683 [Fusarium duplospermum]|uniref:Uncharacterized protein n=1 Tax=Fusarium duplospermum TaxID=1325734 RepID=A0A428R5R6_9HYPO|nr:hypothetical protein CEP54_000683 [Fusarium duplospermum]